MSTHPNKQHTPKVGRHRIYSNEQRKDRNRQAQAAFRDRRNKYTNTLETAIVDFEQRIKRLKETNDESTKRAQIAEQRSCHLASQVVGLQRLLEMALADNQRLQTQMALASTYAGNDVLPPSPNKKNFDKMSSAQLFNDDTFTTTTTIATPTTPTTTATPLDVQLNLLNTMEYSNLTGESFELKSVS